MRTCVAPVDRGRNRGAQLPEQRDRIHPPEFQVDHELAAPAPGQPGLDDLAQDPMRLFEQVAKEPVEVAACRRPKLESVLAPVLDSRVPERASLERAVVDRDHPGAALGRAVAPAARGRTQVGDGLAGSGTRLEQP